MMYKAIGNSIVEYSVSDITNAISNLIADAFSEEIKINGEIIDLKKSSKGTTYFNLTDKHKNIIRACCFENVLKSLKIDLIEGSDVSVYGKIRTYGSQYNITVRNIEYNGVGKLRAIVEERRQRLEKLGLFDITKKLAIPESYHINYVGVITSTKGAVVKDIEQCISRRYPMHIKVCNASVQGPSAVDEILSAIKFFHELPVKPDVIIIARGGGDMQDLMTFNDESIAMAVYHATIPIISAIGHEDDWTILDYVADRRASTPTAAAESVTVPTMQELKDKCAIHVYNLSNIINAQHDRLSSKIATSSSFARSCAMILNNAMHDVSVYNLSNIINAQHDRLSSKIATSSSFARSCAMILNNAMHDVSLSRQSIAIDIDNISSVQNYIWHRDRIRSLCENIVLCATSQCEYYNTKDLILLVLSSINEHDLNLDKIDNDLVRVIDRLVFSYEHNIQTTYQHLKSLSCKSVLARGYALVTTLDKTKKIMNAQDALSSNNVMMHFHDSSILAVASKSDT